MSRQVNLDEALSPEDRQYLLDRDRKDLVAANDAQFAGGDDPSSPETDQFGRVIAAGQTGDVGFNREATGHNAGARNLNAAPVEPSIAGAGNAGLGEQAESDEADEPEEDESPFTAGDPSKAGQAFQSRVDSDDDEDDDEDDGRERDEYDGMKTPALRKELKSRGLPALGGVSEMRARLREDDAAESE
jgi:hypothetical protein